MATKLPTSLPAYISNIFYGIFIQDDDKIAEQVYAQNWSPNVQENENGTPLDFTQFRTLLFQRRAQITNRQLVSQSFLVAPADKEGNAGQVAHTVHFTGVENGKNVAGTIISVIKIVLDSQPSGTPARRMLLTKSCVFGTA